jgi:hemerythrin
MVKIEWDDSLSVGIRLIDEQHKMMIQRIREVYSAIEKSQDMGNIVRTLDFMVEYTNFHFSTEEKHMKEKNYPGPKYHREQHEEFKVTLNRMIEDFGEEGVTNGLKTSVNVFLGNWLINHIKGVDIEFGTFLIEKGFVIDEGR